MATLRNAVRIPKKQPTSLRAVLNAGLWTMASCAVLAAAGCALWIGVSVVRDGWFHQITLYPAQCDDSSCETWRPLPRVRYRVNVESGDVYFWTDPAVGTSVSEDAATSLFHMSKCSIFDRGTWTCWASGRSDIVSFYDGQPARIEILPFDSGLVSLTQGMPKMIRFLDRSEWYMAQYAPGLLAGR